MNTTWVAYNAMGDLIAESNSEDGLLDTLEAAGFDIGLDRIFVGTVSP